MTTHKNKACKLSLKRYISFVRRTQSPKTITKTMNATDANSTQVISAKIIQAIRRGMTLQEAFDFVLGEGSFAQLADDIHDLLTIYRN